MPRAVRTLIASMFSFAIAILPVFGQQTREQGAPPTQQKPDRETKRKMKRTLKELDSAYRQWLTEDVTYIISPEERNAFLQLDTNEEREQFIEQFWLRRSSNPDLPENDFKEEHLPPHCLRQRTLCFRHPRLEDRSWPHVHHVGSGG